MAEVVHLMPVETGSNSNSSSKASSVASEGTQNDLGVAPSENGTSVGTFTDSSESKFTTSSDLSDFRLSLLDGNGSETEWGVGMLGARGGGGGGGLVEKSGTLLPQSTLFHELDDLLCFDHPRVRTECATMISRIASQLGPEDLERCMSVVLPNLVNNLAHDNEEVRRSAARSLGIYIRRSDDPQVAVRTVLSRALFHCNPRLRNTIVQSLPLLYAEDLTDRNWEHVLVCLVSFAFEGEGGREEDEGVGVLALAAVNDLQDLVGRETLTRFIRSQMGEEDQLRANRILGYDLSPPSSSSDTDGSDDGNFTFIDPIVLTRLRDMDDWKGRIEGVEQLKVVVKSRQDLDVLLEGQVPRFLLFLEELLNDPNFKVTLLTLEVYSALIDRLSLRIKDHVTTIVDALVKHLGENKIVVRTQTSKVLSALTHSCGPAPVVAALCKNLTDKDRRQNPRTREEILNAIIFALLTFPSYEFDLYSACTAVAPSLLDSKRRVRQATLECLAVLAQAMGPSKLATIASAIDASSEPHHDTEGALAAVLSRLARRQLPRVTGDGQVEYSLRVEQGRSSGSRIGGRSGFSPPGGSSQGADVDWILTGSGSLNSGSAGSRIVATNGNGEKNQPASFPCSPSAPRRIVSPGNGKNPLPWKELDSSEYHRATTTTTRAPFATRVINELDFVGNVDIRPFPASSQLNGSFIGRKSSLTPSSKGELRYADHSVVNDGSNVFMKNTMMTNQNKILSNNFGASYRIINSGKNSHFTDKAAHRPMDKVAAMIGHNLLPSKLHPISDSVVRSDHYGDYTSLTSTTIVPLPVKSITSNLSNTWPGQNTLPALTPRKNVLGPVTDAPVHTRPTLVRSSSGGKRSKIVVSKSISSVDNGNQVLVSRNTSPKASSPEYTTVDSVTDNGHPKYLTHGKVDSIGRLPTATNDGRLSRVSGRERSPYTNNHRNKESRIDDDYVRARASVDSGVGSLVRPISPSSSMSLRPHSLDLRRSHSLPRNGGNGKVFPLSSSPDIDSRPDLDWNETVLPKKAPSTDSLTDTGLSVSNVSDRHRRRHRSTSVVPSNNSIVEDVVSTTAEDLDDGHKTRSEDLNGKIRAQQNVAFHSSRIRPIALSSHPSRAHARNGTVSVLQPLDNSNHSKTKSNGRLKSDCLILSSPLENAIGKEDGFDVVGKGMWAQGVNTNGVSGVISSPPVPAHRLHSNEQNHHLPSVQGKGVAHRDSIDDNDDDDPHSMSLSRSTFNKMMNRKLEIAQEAERRKIGKHNTSDQGAKRFENNNKGEEMNTKTPPEKRPAARRKPRYSVPSGQKKGLGVDSGLNSSMKSVGSSQSRTSIEVDQNLLRNPDEALKVAYRKLENEDWHAKCEGIKIVVALAKQEPNVISGDMHNVNLALVAEVKNLRSTVSRAAIQCFGDLFACTKKSMENDLEMICKTLLHKSGESNVFIKEDVEKALIQMVEAVTPQKACLALILGGATHRNAAVRKTTAQFLCIVCEKLGPSRILSGTKDVTDRILPTAALFVMDGSPLTRYYGRKMFFMLISNSEFDRVLRQNVPSNTLRNIQGILGGLRTKGLGTMPNESASSRLKASLK